MDKPNYKKLKAKWKRRRQRIVKLKDEQGLTYEAIAKKLQEKGKPPITKQQVHKLYAAEKARMENSND